MQIDTTQVRAFTIHGAPALDPITVFLEDWRPGAGRITVVCWGRSWSASWGAMGDRTVEQFVAACGEGYVADNLENDQHRMLKQYRGTDRNYLLRIVRAVQQAIRETQPAGGGNAD